MECPKCHSVYQKEKNVPLLLIKCGHTLCDACANSSFMNGSIVCPECNSESQVTSVSALPKNMALLSMSCPTVAPQTKPAPATVPETLCEQHKKKVEAFCADDRTLLCIDCILLNGHKAHDISPISQAAEKERDTIQKDLEVTNKLEDTLTLMLSDIENFKADISAKANAKRDKVTSVFKEITNVIHERESLLKQNISNILEKEEEALKTATAQINEHLDSIAVFKSSAVQIQNETDCMMLEKSKERKKQSLDANKTPPPVSFNINFPDIKREKELENIWKILSPQTTTKPNSNLYSTTASYASKRTDKARTNIKPHAESHSNNGLKGGKKKPVAQLTAVGNDMDKILSPRRELSTQDIRKIQPIDLLKQQSQILDTSGISSCSSSIPTSKTPIPTKEESKGLFNSNNKTTDIESDGSSIDSKKADIAETVILDTVPCIPTTLITMPQQQIEERKEYVPSENYSTRTPKDITIRNKFVQPDISVASVSAPSTATPAKSNSSNDIFTALREKREKHKREKESKAECKVDSEALKELSINAPAPTVAVISNLPTKVSKDEKEGENAVVAVETKTVPMQTPQVAAPAELKQEDTLTAMMPKMSEGYSAFMESAQKTQYTPSVTSSLFDLYVNSEECDRMDLHSLLGRVNQYIYSFCIFVTCDIVIAGYGETGLCACEKYDVQQAIWKEIKPLSKARSKFSAACTADGSTIVMGGKLLVLLKF